MSWTGLAAIFLFICKRKRKRKTNATSTSVATVGHIYCFLITISTLPMILIIKSAWEGVQKAKVSAFNQHGQPDEWYGAWLQHLLRSLEKWHIFLMWESYLKALIDKDLLNTSRGRYAGTRPQPINICIHMSLELDYYSCSWFWCSTVIACGY